MIAYDLPRCLMPPRRQHDVTGISDRSARRLEKSLWPDRSSQRGPLTAARLADHGSFEYSSAVRACSCPRPGRGPETLTRRAGCLIPFPCVGSSFNCELGTPQLLTPNPQAPSLVLLGDPFLRGTQAEPNAALQSVRVALEQEVCGAGRQQVVRKDVQLA